VSIRLLLVNIKLLLHSYQQRGSPGLTEFSYLDRINVSNARLAGMQKDLHMSDTMWSAGISLFYVGYIISQVPANVIMAKGKPRVLLPCCMLGWSVTTICMPAVTAGWGFLLCRFVVGLTEGPFVPAVSLMTSSWYTKHEAPLRSKPQPCPYY
jgi:MFS family permease